MAIPSQADLACRAAELGGRLDDAFSGAVTLCDAGLTGIVGMREPLGRGLRDPLRGTLRVTVVNLRVPPFEQSVEPELPFTVFDMTSWLAATPVNAVVRTTDHPEAQLRRASE